MGKRLSVLLLRILIILTFMALPITSACAKPAATTTVPAAPATTPALASKYGGVLRFQGQAPSNMPYGDPLQIFFGPVGPRAAISLEPLLLPGDKPGTYRYMLATGFKLAPDKSYYDINLRKGIKFHDGTDFNAAAVKWNLDRVKAAKQAELQKVTSIAVVDDYTVRLNLSSWNNAILNDLMAMHCYMISPTAFEKNGAEWALTHPVGTGPFVYKETRNNQILVWERNNDYWDKGLPYLDGIEEDIIADDMVAFASYKAGEIDFLSSMDMQTAALLENDPNSYLIPFNVEEVGVFYMNTMDPKCVWSDVRMRQALEYALDKEAIGKAFSNYATPAYNIIRGIEKHRQLNIVKRTYDPAKAKELMAAAGYPDGLNFKMYNITGAIAGPFHNSTIVQQSQLAQVGFKMEIVPVEMAKIIEMTSSPMPGNDVMTTAITGDFDSPIRVVVEQLAEGASLAGVKRPAEWSSLLEQALQTEDIEKSLDLLAKMDELAYEEAMVVPITNSALPNAVSSRVHDFSRSMRRLELAQTWLSQE